MAGKRTKQYHRLSKAILESGIDLKGYFIYGFPGETKEDFQKTYNRELLIDRREKSKSLAWSSVVLAFENSKRILEEVKKPKALGDIRGVSYIYPILWRLGLIRVPEAIEKKIGKQR